MVHLLSLPVAVALLLLDHVLELADDVLDVLVGGRAAPLLLDLRQVLTEALDEPGVGFMGLGMWRTALGHKIGRSARKKGAKRNHQDLYVTLM